VRFWIFCKQQHSMNELTPGTLGWDSWFEAQAESMCGTELSAARVVTVDRDRFLLLD
jgi:hypothetical protein